MKNSGRSWLLTIYILAVCTAGITGLSWGLFHWGPTGLHPWEFLAFLALASVLDLMVVPLLGGGSAAASFAAFFAGLLLLGPIVTSWVAVLAGVLSDGLIKRRPLERVGFNVFHSAFSLLAAGAIFQMLGGHIASVSLPQQLLPVVAAALSLWLLETGWVTIAVTLERGGRAWRRIKASLVQTLALDGALASAGLLLALLYQSRGQLAGQFNSGAIFLVVIALIPSALLYYAYRLQGHMRRGYAQILRTLGLLLEAKVKESAPGRGERVAATAVALAEAMQLPAHDVEQIRYAAYLHEIGKVGVPGEVLQYESDNNLGEPPELRKHSEVGAQILGSIRFLRPAAEMVLYHHERWDGLGYPQGLRQKQIPLGARMLFLADAYVEMAASNTVTHSRVLSQLNQASGSRFDPELVKVLEAVTTSV